MVAGGGVVVPKGGITVSGSGIVVAIGAVVGTGSGAVIVPDGSPDSDRCLSFSACAYCFFMFETQNC